MKLTKSQLKQLIREEMNKTLEAVPDIRQLARGGADEIITKLTYGSGMKFGVTGTLHGKLQQAIHDVLALHLPDIQERELTKPEKKEKERLVKGMKKSKSEFEKQYPDRGEEVMYATATKIAKKGE